VKLPPAGDMAGNVPRSQPVTVISPTVRRWSIGKFVRTARRYRAVQIRAGQRLRTLTAEDPLPPGLRDALALPASRH
jgi:hypothetical protein